MPSSESIAHAKIRCNIHKGARKCFRGFSYRHGGRYGKAALARTSECAIADDLGAHIEIRIRHDDDIILSTALALHPLAVTAPCA